MLTHIRSGIYPLYLAVSRQSHATGNRPHLRISFFSREVSQTQFLKLQPAHINNKYTVQKR